MRPAGSDVELRQDFALELQREVSARRAYEQQLHEMVRREIETIQRVVGDQLGQLREDVATLRGDLVDQVGGKIRLERIETTRVIGSDIEALQNEVRQLAGSRFEGMNKLTDPPMPAAPAVRVVDAGSGANGGEPADGGRNGAGVAAGQPGAIRAVENAAPTADPIAVDSNRPAADVCADRHLHLGRDRAAGTALLRTAARIGPGVARSGSRAAGSGVRRAGADDAGASAADDTSTTGADDTSTAGAAARAGLGVVQLAAAAGTDLVAAADHCAGGRMPRRPPRPPRSRQRTERLLRR